MGFVALVVVEGAFDGAVDRAVDGEFWPRQIVASARRSVITGSRDRRLAFLSLSGKAGSSALTGFGMTSSFNILEFEMGIVVGRSCGFAEQLSIADLKYLSPQPLVGFMAPAQLHLQIIVG